MDREGEGAGAAAAAVQGVEGGIVKAARPPLAISTTRQETTDPLSGLQQVPGLPLFDPLRHPGAVPPMDHRRSASPRCRHPGPPQKNSPDFSHMVAVRSSRREGVSAAPVLHGWVNQ